MVLSKGRRCRSDFVDCIVFPGSDHAKRKLQFSISGKLFNAVKRNTIKRRIKAFLGVNYPQNSEKLVFIIKKKFSLQEKNVLLTAVTDVLDKAGIRQNG
ncbi:MAG: ribonuclease P protein component [Ignavibacteriaceae bacterium]|jgi:ribonuclease P protein component|nr:ribonuclease P protein component [Ignavibacteriaceae bacterium]